MLLRKWFDADAAPGTPPAAPLPVSQGSPAPEPNSGVKTQEDIDRAAGKAREEGRTKAINDLLKELELDSPDTLKSLVSAAKAKSEADKSEAQKALEAAEKAAAKATEWETKYKELDASLRTERLENAALEAIRAAGAKKPADVLKLMKVDNLLKDALSEDGKPNPDALTKVITAFKKDNADYFQSNNPGVPSNAGAKPPKPGADVQNKARDDMKKWAKF